MCKNDLTSLFQEKIGIDSTGIVIILGEEQLLEIAKEGLRDKTKTLFLRDDIPLNDEATKLNRDHFIIASPTERMIDHIRRGNIDLEPAGCLIHIRDKANRVYARAHQDIIYIKSNMNNLNFIWQIDIISEGSVPWFFKTRFLLKYSNAKEKKMSKINESMISAMDELLTKTKGDSNPEKLAEYKKLFKKSVPLGFRGWVTAFLLKEYLSKSKTARMPVLKEGVSLFVGIGKNRKVYPKDLIHLFINTGKIDREAIGEIKILDNYAFVAVEKKSADTAIDNLNGINYRGRSLTVNYAKQK